MRELIAVAGVLVACNGELNPRREPELASGEADRVHVDRRVAASEADLVSRVRNEELRFTRADTGWRAVNRASGVRAVVSEDGATIRGRRADPQDWKVSLSTASVGRTDRRIAARAAAPAAGPCDIEAIPMAGADCLRRLEVARAPGWVEWWRNSPGGLEHGFDVARRPHGLGRVEIRLAWASPLRAEASAGGTAASFHRGQAEEVLRYHGLHAMDSAGRTLPAVMEVAGAEILLLVDDSEAAYPIRIDPLLTAPANVQVFESDQVGGRAGISVSGAGDINRDGYDDVVVGAPDYDGGGAGDGAVFLFLGSDAGVQGAYCWGAFGEQSGGAFGVSVAGAGDVDGDGCSDVVVGAYQFNDGEENEGKVWVFHGHEGVCPDVLDSGADLQSAALWSYQFNQAEAYAAFSVAGAGDVDRDGLSDIVIGAYSASDGEQDEGLAWLFLGPLGADPDYQFDENVASAEYASVVAGAGDVNGDGFDDVLIGSPRWDGGQNDEGRVFVYFGGDDGINDVPGPTILQPDVAGRNFGGSLAPAGDVNGDGFDDFLVGARDPNLPSADGPVAEGAYLFLGSNAGVDLGNDEAGASWFVNPGVGGIGFGTSVAGVGDLDRDGYSDVAVGAPLYDGGNANQGRVYVYRGSPGGLADVEDDTLQINSAGARFGFSVGPAGDVNGDDFPDLIVGAPEYSNGEDEEGAVYVYHGGCVGDGNDCGVGLCHDGVCDEASCFIANTWYAGGTPNPGNPCELCAPGTSQTAWSPAGAGTACTADGLACTTDACDGAGSCVATPAGDECTIAGACVPADAIDPANECRACVPAQDHAAYTDRSGTPACDDGDADTVDDVCRAGVCSGTPDGGDADADTDADSDGDTDADSDSDGDSDSDVDGDSDSDGDGDADAGTDGGAPYEWTSRSDEGCCSVAGGRASSTGALPGLAILATLIVRRSRLGRHRSRAAADTPADPS